MCCRGMPKRKGKDVLDMTKQCTLSFGRAQMSLERPVLPSTPAPAYFRAPPPRPTMAGSPHTFGSGSGMDSGSERSGYGCTMRMMGVRRESEGEDEDE